MSYSEIFPVCSIPPTEDSSATVAVLSKQQCSCPHLGSATCLSTHHPFRENAYAIVIHMGRWSLLFSDVPFTDLYEGSQDERMAYTSNKR